MARAEQSGAAWETVPGPVEAAKPPRVSRRMRRILGGTLAATLALTAAGSLARRGDDSDPGTGGQAGGLAPALAPSNQPAAPVASETPGSSTAPSEQAPPAQNYAGEADCAGLEVTRPNATTLHITPKITKSGNPDPSRYVTVAESLTGDNPSKFTEQKVYYRLGLGESVNVRVPEDMSILNTSVPVSLAYFPPGTKIPRESEAFSISNENVEGVFLGCGNAALQWLQENGGIRLPSGTQLPQ